jgi:hypothetical protein
MSNQIDTVEDIEMEDDNYIMVTPFNPKDIDIQTRTLSIDLLVKRLREEPPEIDLFPDFQRNDNIWNEVKQSRLIESILIQFPLPAFYFDGSNNNNWLVVDGLQRLSAVRNFVIEEKHPLVLKGLEFLTHLEGKTFKDLTRPLQRQIEETQITAYIIKPGTPNDVKYNIFKRINTGGTILTSQEIRHALFHGKPTQFLKRLSESIEFKKSVKINSERMLDREFILRFLSFYLNDVDKYKGDLDSWLNDTMKLLYTIDDTQLNDIQTQFEASIITIKYALGKHAFRKYLKKEQRKYPLNKSLFEVWTVVVAKLSEEEKNFLRKNRTKLKEEVALLMSSDEEFIKSITSSTNNTYRVKYRFITIYNLIQKFLHNDN